jgi:tripartite-type tricarboxylate transporter receptor subunit TctC
MISMTERDVARPDRLRRLLVSTPLMLAAAAVTRSALAQAPYPNRPIRIVSGLAAGSVSDISLRILADRMTQLLHVPVVIENQPGTGGVNGARTVMNAPPDGYTVALGGNNWAISLALFKSLPLDFRTDLTPIMEFTEFAYVFVTSVNSKYQTLQQVIAAGKDKNSKLTIGTSNAGTTNHLIAYLFKSALDLDFVVVPYRGASELQVAMLRNDVDVVINAYGGLRQGIEQKQIRALATSTPTRIAQLPDVPTVQEASGKDFEASSWNSFYAPNGTPAEVKQVFADTVTKILAEPDIQKRFAELGLIPKPSSAAEIDRRMRSETDRWARVIKEASIERQ